MLPFFSSSKECLPYLEASKHAHILNISPPLNMNPKWFSNHVAYTMAKYGMSMCVLGMAMEFQPKNIAVNALWPRTSIHTAAMEMLAGDASFKVSRKPEIMADAAYVILCRSPNTTTGQFLIDDDVLKESGINDFKPYACDPNGAEPLMPDFFLDDDSSSPVEAETSSKGEIGALFDKIEKLLSAELVKKVNAVYQFNVTGSEQGSWFLDLKNGSGKLGKGPATSPDSTLTMDSKNFFAMFTGKLKPTSAFMSGKLKISGDMAKSMKLESLLVSLKSKL